MKTESVFSSEIDESNYHEDPQFSDLNVEPATRKGDFPYRPMSISEIMAAAAGNTDKKEEIYQARKFIKTYITGSSDPTMINMKKRKKTNKNSSF